MILLVIVIIICFMTACSDKKNIIDNKSALPDKGTASSREPFHFVSLNMFNVTTGWAIGVDDKDSKTKVLRTINGGSTWKDTTPELSQEGPIADINSFFLNQDTGWIVILHDIKTSKEAIATAIYRTVNGGRSWNRYIIKSYIPRAKLYFINQLIGWMMVYKNSGAGANPMDMYVTKDGGKMWTKIPETSNQTGSLPIYGLKESMAFLNAQRGWVAGQSNENDRIMLYGTEDGGSSWNYEWLSIPDKFKSNPVLIRYLNVFENDVVVAAIVSNQVQNYGAIYHLDTVSNKWTTTSLCPIKGYALFTFIDSKNGWIKDDVALYSTTDGGRTWDTVVADVLKGVSQLDFVTKKLGWAFDDNALYKTDDGGKTWTQLPK